MPDPMIKDIEKQSKYLNKILDKYFNDNKYNNRLKKVVSLIENSNKPLIFAGMGSSNFASISAINILAEKSYLSIRPEIDEFIHYQMDAISSGYTIIAISQSGRSVETRKFLEKEKSKNKIIVVTNDEDSPIAKMGDYVLPIFADKESAISTKTYTNSNYLLNILAYLTNGYNINLKKQKSDIKQLANFIKSEKKDIKRIFNYLANRNKLTFISRGDLLTIAYMGALIFGESSALQAVGLSGGSFRHGPLEVTGTNHSTILIARDDKTFALLSKLAEEIAFNKSKVVLLSDKSYIPRNDNILFHKIPKLNRLLAPSIFAVSLQLFAREAAISQGRNPGMVSKIFKVTEKE